MSVAHYLLRLATPRGIWLCSGCGFGAEFGIASTHHDELAGLGLGAWLRYQLSAAVPPSAISEPWSYAGLAERAGDLLDALGARSEGRLVLLPAGTKANRFFSPSAGQSAGGRGIPLEISPDVAHLRLRFWLAGDVDPHIVNLPYPDRQRPVLVPPERTIAWRAQGFCPACGCSRPPGPNSGHWSGDDQGVSGCILHGRSCDFVYDQNNKTWYDRPDWRKPGSRP